MLDPACGSGTFLYHAARRIAGVECLQGASHAERAEAAAALVNGIDIHPVAVEMAKTNVARALPADIGRDARVWMGDALAGPDEAMSLFRKDGFLHIESPQKREIRPARMPREQRSRGGHTPAPPIRPPTAESAEPGRPAEPCPSRSVDD